MNEKKKKDQSLLPLNQNSPNFHWTVWGGLIRFSLRSNFISEETYSLPPTPQSQPLFRETLSTQILLKYPNFEHFWSLYVWLNGSPSSFVHFPLPFFSFSSSSSSTTRFFFFFLYAKRKINYLRGKKWMKFESKEVFSGMLIHS